MRFGIFYEHQLPRPWSADSEHRLLQESLRQIELADRLGYDYAWEVEHHFLEEYSHSSAPEVFLGAASQRTSRIRLGHGIIQLPTNHPIRVAERVATLDLVSGGRVELGLGEGQGPIELHPFGRRVRDKREVWEEAVQVMVQCFTQEAVEFHAREAEHQQWKSAVLEGRLVLEQTDTSAHKVYAHQNEDIVRLTPEELKQKMAAKEAARAAGGRPA